MTEQNQFHHIKIKGYSRTENYTSPRSFYPDDPIPRNRKLHGIKIKDHLEKIRNQFKQYKEQDTPEEIRRDNVIYVEFISDFNIKPAFDSLHSDAKNASYQLISIKLEKVEEKERFRVLVMLTEGGITHFLSRVNEYIQSTTEKPKHARLVSNLAAIKLATLREFWTEPDENPFPEEDEMVWWEVWFRKKKGIEPSSEYDKIASQLELVNAQISEQALIFPEHFIKLVKASPRQLSESLFLLDNLAELRKPKETADFFTTLNLTETEDAVSELQARIKNHTNDNSIAICILKPKKRV